MTCDRYTLHFKMKNMPLDTSIMDINYMSLLLYICELKHGQENGRQTNLSHKPFQWIKIAKNCEIGFRKYKKIIIDKYLSSKFYLDYKTLLISYFRKNCNSNKTFLCCTKILSFSMIDFSRIYFNFPEICWKWKSFWIVLLLTHYMETNFNCWIYLILQKKK